MATVGMTAAHPRCPQPRHQEEVGYGVNASGLGLDLRKYATPRPSRWEEIQQIRPKESDVTCYLDQSRRYEWQYLHLGNTLKKRESFCAVSRAGLSDDKDIGDLSDGEFLWAATFVGTPRTF